MERAVAGMFDQAYVFQLVVYRLDYAAFPQHYFVVQAHQLVFHVFAYASNEVDAVGEQQFFQTFAYIAFVAI